jgi:hypothetical protein
MPVIMELASRLFVLLFVASWPTDQVGVIAAVSVVSVTALAVVLAARCVTASVAVLLSVREGHASREPADVGVLLSQSDPDADGHPRPRAPGHVLAVA